MTKETKKRQDIAAPQTGWNCAVRLFNLNKASFNSTICPLCQATVSSHSWSYIVNGAVEKAGCFLDSGRPYTQISSEHFHHSAHRPSAADQSAHFVLPWPISVFSEELVHTLVPISVVIDEELYLSPPLSGEEIFIHKHTKWKLSSSLQEEMVGRQW